MEKNIPTLRERVKAIIEQEYTCREVSAGKASICYCDSINCIDDQQVSAILSLMSEVAEDCVRSVEENEVDRPYIVATRQYESDLNAVRECAKKYIIPKV